MPRRRCREDEEDELIIVTKMKEDRCNRARLEKPISKLQPWLKELPAI